MGTFCQGGDPWAEPYYAFTGPFFYFPPSPVLADPKPSSLGWSVVADQWKRSTLALWVPASLQLVHLPKNGTQHRQRSSQQKTPPDWLPCSLSWEFTAATAGERDGHFYRDWARNLLSTHFFLLVGNMLFSHSPWEYHMMLQYGHLPGSFGKLLYILIPGHNSYNCQCGKSEERSRNLPTYPCIDLSFHLLTSLGSSGHQFGVSLD